MNRLVLALKRPFIWIYRFRHRCGYGVHSPFAFNLITHVIYENTPYYKYKDLVVAQKKLALEKDKYWKYYPIYLVTVFIDLILEVLLRRRLYKKEEQL